MIECVYEKGGEFLTSKRSILIVAPMTLQVDRNAKSAQQQVKVAYYYYLL